MNFKSRLPRNMILVGAIALSTSLVHGQRNNREPLIPKLFPVVRIGSIVNENGAVGREVAFDLELLSPRITVTSLQSSRSLLTGNSTFNARASASSLVASLAYEFGFGAIGASGVFESASSGASRAQNTQVTSSLIGVNRVAFIRFQNLSPNSLMAALDPDLHERENSVLQELGSALRALERYLETNSDVDTQRAQALIRRISNAQARFKKSYGVGFVSGVVFGGAAAVRGNFAASASSTQSRWSSDGRVYGATTGGSRFQLRTAFGTMNENQISNASFDVEDGVLGGGRYVEFARELFGQFSNRALSALWEANFAQLPPTGNLLTKQEASLPPPNRTPQTKIPSLAEKFAPIQNARQLKLYNQALAFDNWNKKRVKNRQGIGTFEEFESFLSNQRREALDRNDTPGVLLGGTRTERRRARAPRILSKSIEPIENDLLVGRNTPAQTSNFADRYWAAAQGDFEVIAVETTRWEDVIPGLGFAETLIANTRAGREFVESNQTLQSFRFLSNMYSLASTCIRDGSRGETNGYIALANAFRGHERDLARRLAKDQGGSPLQRVRRYLNNMPADEREIYQVFVLNRDLFTAGEIGMGGYGIFRRLEPSTQTRPARFGSLEDLTPNRGGIRFSQERIFTRSDRRDLHSPNLYASAVKFFVLLQPDIRNFRANGENSEYEATVRLMASTFNPNANLGSRTANGFLSQVRGAFLFSSSSVDQPIEVPLSRIRTEKMFGSREYVFPFPTTGPFVYVSGGTDRRAVAGWGNLGVLQRQSPAQRRNIYLLEEIRLRPFTLKEIGDLDWRGFLAYEQGTETALERYWGNVTRNFARSSRGVNYFTQRYRNTPINLDDTFDPGTLNQFLSYLGLIEAPSTFPTSRR